MIFAVSHDEERVIKRLFGNKAAVMTDTAPPIFLQPVPENMMAGVPLIYAGLAGMPSIRPSSF